jgi:hypothetical protein
MAKSVPDKPGYSVVIKNIIGSPFVRAEIAIAIAEVILRHRWSPEEAESQMPLRVEDKGPVWGVLGRGHGGTEEVPDRWFCLIIRMDNGMFVEAGIFSGPGGVP